MRSFADDIINSLPDPLITLDQNFSVLSVNHAFCDLFRVKPENTIGQIIYDLGNKQWDLPELRESLKNISLTNTSFNDYEVDHYFETIGRRVMSLNAQPLAQAKGDEPNILLTIKDITERVNELAIANKEKAKLVDELVIVNQEKTKLADELAIANKETAKRVNELAIAKAKWTDKLAIADEEKANRAEELVIANRELVLQNKQKDKRADELVIANKEKDKRANELDIANKELAFQNQQKDKRADELATANAEKDKRADELATANAEKDKRANELVIANKEKDIHTEELILANKKLVTYQSKIEHIAHYDSLTSLPNREFLADRLSHNMAQSLRRKTSLAVAFMDLDAFKEVNDAYGHDVGDQLLVEVSKRMKACLRDGDTLARIGGDEFIAVMVDLEKLEDSMPLCKRLIEAVSKTFTMGNRVIQVSVSIGVAYYPQDGNDADQLIRRADQAMYIAKQAGKNRYQLFDLSHEKAVTIKLESISKIRSALERREFVLHYQPKVNMRTGVVIGVEALIRWQHPERGLLPPLELLSLIEGEAVSLELGEWVIDCALSQFSQWQSLGLSLPISVNISSHLLQQDNFTTRLAALLSAHSEVNPNCLELEILETTALNDISKVSATMKACTELGVSFALDDFGTGYSSLTYLKCLPAHMIKIDQSFVRNMLDDTDDLAIVTGVISLSKAFQRDVIAEGLETIAHGEALLKLGCELAQGYGIARPMPADDIPEWASNWKISFFENISLQLVSAVPCKSK